jgi:hypothetical protein
VWNPIVKYDGRCPGWQQDRVATLVGLEPPAIESLTLSVLAPTCPAFVNAAWGDDKEQFDPVETSRFYENKLPYQNWVHICISEQIVSFVVRNKNASQPSIYHQDSTYSSHKTTAFPHPGKI